MGSDLSMNPPPSPEYVYLLSADRLRVAQYGIYLNYCWDKEYTLVSSRTYTVGMHEALKWVHKKVYETKLEGFPETISQGAMLEIRSPRPKVYEGRHRGCHS